MLQDCYPLRSGCVLKEKSGDHISPDLLRIEGSNYADKGVVITLYTETAFFKDAHQPVNQCIQMFLYLGVINFYATTQKAVT